MNRIGNEAHVNSLIRNSWRRAVPVAAAAALVPVVLAGCGSSGQTQPGAPGSSGSSGAVAVLPADAAHIHGMAITGDATLLATHAGLWRLSGSSVERVGTQEIDLMGFTAAGAGHFYASGHPHGDTELQNPVGLIESTDGGVSWTYLSRGGESDFHALSNGGGAIYGYDGQLRVTRDGTTWQTPSTSIAPAALAVSPADGNTVLATTQQGVQKSTDGGRTFAPIAGAPLSLLLSWPQGSTVWALTPDGALYLSRDGAATWARQGQVSGDPAALTAVGDSQVSVATSTGVYSSSDAGLTFTQLARP